MYLFKKQGSAPQSADIASYFAGNLTNDELKELGLFVFTDIPQTILYKLRYDFTVLNTKAYYYTGVIKNTTSGELSTNITANGTPAPTFKLNVVDGKSIVFRAVEKVIDSLKALGTDDIPRIPADLDIARNYTQMKPDSNAFQVIISRGAGQLSQQSFSQVTGSLGNDLVKGVIDLDVITIEWICVAQPIRRDNFTNIMRIMRPVMQYYIMKMGNMSVQGVKFIMGGDGQIMENGANIVTGMMTVALEIQNQLQIGGGVTRLPLESITTTYEA
jgi:hypothetical protein